MSANKYDFNYESPEWSSIYDTIYEEYNYGYENMKNGIDMKKGRYTEFDEDEIKSSNHYILYASRNCPFYNDGKFGDYLKQCDKYLMLSAYSDNYMGVLKYNYQNEEAILEYMVRSNGTIKRNEEYVSKMAFQYFDNGNIYFLHYYSVILTAVVCDDNDIPQYIIYLHDWNAFPPEENNTDDNILSVLDRLVSNGQQIFDFDFYNAALKYYYGRSDESVFKSDKVCFESELKNKIAYIDEYAYYFDKIGKCTGRCNGWIDVKASDGTVKKKYYRYGTMLTGKWNINGVVCRFDRNGVLLTD